MNRQKKIVFNIIPVALLIACIIMSPLANSMQTEKKAGKATEAATDVDKVLTVTNLNVGDADAAVLQYAGHAGMIDTAMEEQLGDVTSFLDDKGITELDFLLLTHYDQDHIGTASELLDRYEIKTVFIPDYESHKRYYPGLMEALKGHKDVRVVEQNMVFTWEDIRVEIYPAIDKEHFAKNEDDMDNNMSLVSLFTIGSNRLLFAGDIETDRIEELLDSGINLDCNWLKVPHHGRSQKKVKKFIETTSPEYAIISCEKKKVDANVVSILKDVGTETYKTGKKNVITKCSQDEIFVRYENEEDTLENVWDNSSEGTTEADIDMGSLLVTLD